MLSLLEAFAKYSGWRRSTGHLGLRDCSPCTAFWFIAWHTARLWLWKMRRTAACTVRRRTETFPIQQHDRIRPCHRQNNANCRCIVVPLVKAHGVFIPLRPCRQTRSVCLWEERDAVHALWRGVTPSGGRDRGRRPKMRFVRCPNVRLQCTALSGKAKGRKQKGTLDEEGMCFGRPHCWGRNLFGGHSESHQPHKYCHRNPNPPPLGRKGLGWVEGRAEWGGSTRTRSQTRDTHPLNPTTWNGRARGNWVRGVWKPLGKVWHRLQQ